jgi:hypothetical protein
VRLLTHSSSIRLQSRQLPYLSPRLTDPQSPRLVVSSGQARGASFLLHLFKILPSVFCSGPKEAHYKRARRFTLSTPKIWHTNCMTCGPGPPCHRLGCRGPRYGFTRVQQLAFRILSQLLAPLCLRASPLHARAAAHVMASLGYPDRFQSEEALNLVCSLLGWSALGLAGRIRVGAIPLDDLAAGEFVLFTSYISYGLALSISPFFLLLLEEFGLQLQHLTPHFVLQAAIFVHPCEMFVGVALCTSLFRYFFVLVKSGKTRDHIGAYYF